MRVVLAGRADAMSIIILIPGILCAIALLRENTQRAFLNICLATIMVAPTYYYWKVPYLPPMTFMQTAMLVLGIGMIATNLSQWKFSRMDLWMALFIFTTGYADFKGGNFTISVFELFYSIVDGLFAYMAGKLLIEQAGTRIQTSKRFAWLLFLVCIPSMYEFFRKSNPYQYFWNHLFPGQWSGWWTQIRWGFGRVAGPYAQSELAGMVFFTGLFLSLWLAESGYWEPHFSRVGQLPVKKSTAISGVLALTLYMCQARGPWFGAILAGCFAYVGRAENVLRRSIIVGGLAVAIGLPGYLAAKNYLNAPTTSDEQQTAQYRQQLFENYLPVAKLGGPWGWGLEFPVVDGQVSIDNQYLITYLVQGYMGLIAFILIMLEAAASLVAFCYRTRSRRDRHFGFTMLGILAGFALTLGTVFLGSQPYTIFFLLIGWTQALRWAKQDKIHGDAARVETNIGHGELLRVFT